MWDECEIFMEKALKGGINKFRKFNDEVYYSKEIFIKLDKNDILLLKQKANINTRQRSRLCTHRTTKDKIHEMFIVQREKIYICPHKHLKKIESIHVIEGYANIIIFDDKGKITQVIEMGDHKSGYKFYYKMSQAKYHTMLVISNYFIFHEITNGPFKKSDTVFAPWAPNEDDIVSQRKFLINIEQSAKNFLSKNRKRNIKM